MKTYTIVYEIRAYNFQGDANMFCVTWVNTASAIKREMDNYLALGWRIAVARAVIAEVR